MRSGRLFCLASGVGSWGELVEALDGADGESGQDRGQVVADGQPESAATLDDGKDRRHFWASLLVPDVHPVTSTDSDSTDILPMSGKNWRFTIAGTRFMGVRCAFEIANNVAAGVSSMWTTALAQSQSFPHGCRMQWYA